MTRIAIIGGGNMGEALLAGLLAAGRPVKDLVVAERYGERARQLSEKYSVLVTSVADAIENASVVIVAVKPQDVDAVVEEFAKSVTAASGDNAEQVLVTIVAGLTTGYVESKLPAGAAVVRVMPNTPVKVGAGASALAKGRFASSEQVSEVAALFECVGTVAIVPEEQMDAVTAVSGSGPAYFFLVVEALVDAGVAAGLSRQAATDLAVQTMAGSAQMLLEERGESEGAGAANGVLDTAPTHLRAMVTSPGGTTAAALRELEAGGLRTSIDRAVQAAKTRSEQLRITSE
ncbi:MULTISPECIES: pyrroline-5-carboxylate reductase [Mycolicibacter]|uniref:Pyrroline-5-carboxylate reductase n=1 Tax=Mycolicibacter virginiensis TaxID=1795032 RepID=A0A9X7IS89_9MYCO|nr:MULTISPECIES: pyrroline-5-carboxylate reductase [Mycobacteriaceae]OBG35823.1 pyrroline-5-carboxylate reductase [Mycolicibacter heraklionensis]OBJ32069.1 pyrroline-5-carboxylate reductase [Mycolicibacter heraklionensis]PQM54178.1 pyrroline-5-carboxylate reductase [Mycolicibacter virginiensis]ULP48132.1 pyrroline-5-carboxylate reductase [Mycolicibacter virginiensis]